MNEKPKLGTIDSALVNCVSLISAVTAQRIEDLAGWLDLYYQIRRWWEISQGKETDPQLIRKDDLLPILDTAVREAMRGTAMKAAEAVATKKKRKPAAKDQDRSLSPSGGDKRGTSHASRASGCSLSQREPGAAEDAKTEKAAGTEPSKPGPWTLYKRKVYNRLQQARADGYTIAQIADASGGILSDGKVMSAINAAPLRQEEWKAMEVALDTVTRLQIPEEEKNEA